MQYEHIVVRRDGDVAIIQLANEKALNAMSLPMVDEIRWALGHAPETARAVVLSGSGRAFSAGASTTDLDPERPGYDVGSIIETHFNPLILQIRDYPIPIIMAVNGVAAGIGCSLALSGDLVVMAEGAYFLEAFRTIGLIPDGGATWVLPRLVGRARAMEMMLLDERIPATKALQWGLVNRVTPDADVLNEAVKLAHNLASGPTQALAMMRRLVWEGLDADFPTQLYKERTVQRDIGRTGDHREGMRAFREKRRPDFKGH